ncbi:camphor resistance protein CrcB [Leptolyngbya sp. 'hensonii']|uniref:fluoride efflux transporter CrcB n=1 Tax=Leptolyngbya sp. 'hensonii' TaxID=1922337 RepID=UPI00094F4E2C|nr:fluoride efflux transporter CrcB [Leptolyngbya sp. 'hensonii']OLP18775.1 camphor resistance protein CrcB [Leptolyngbya sp. 'hensonii']
MFQDPAIRYPIAISLGAIAGALSRYYLTLWFAQQFGTGFPSGTFAINLSGCFGMGLFVTLVLERSLQVPPELQLLITTGFLGAYTTFSTYGLDTVMVFRVTPIAAIFYGLASPVLGVGCVYLGSTIGRILRF